MSYRDGWLGRVLAHTPGDDRDALRRRLLPEKVVRMLELRDRGMSITDALAIIGPAKRTDHDHT